MSCDDQLLALLVWSLESRQSLDGTLLHSSSFFLFPVAIQTSFETSLYLTRSLRLDAFFLSIPPFYHDVWRRHDGGNIRHVWLSAKWSKKKVKCLLGKGDLKCWVVYIYMYIYITLYIYMYTCGVMMMYRRKSYMGRWEWAQRRWR